MLFESNFELGNEGIGSNESFKIYFCSIDESLLLVTSKASGDNLLMCEGAACAIESRLCM